MRCCRCEVAVGQWWSDAAEYISEGVHGGSHLAGHHCSGEQLVQLNQLVGCGVKLERNAVQRVPRFHLDHKTRERTQNHTPAAVQGISLKLYREDLKTWHRWRETERERGWKTELCNYYFKKVLTFDFCMLDFGIFCKLKLSAVDQEYIYLIKHLVYKAPDKHIKSPS